MKKEKNHFLSIVEALQVFDAKYNLVNVWATFTPFEGSAAV